MPPQAHELLGVLHDRWNSHRNFWGGIFTSINGVYIWSSMAWDLALLNNFHIPTALQVVSIKEDIPTGNGKFKILIFPPDILS